jgi:hypothetical protein
MGILVIILLVVAAVLFAAGFFRKDERWNLVSGGLFFCAVVWILEHLPG